MDFTIASLSTVNRVLRLSITVSTGADRCEPVPQQLFVFLGRLYDVQPVGNPEQPERQYLLPVHQLVEI